MALSRKLVGAKRGCRRRVRRRLPPAQARSHPALLRASHIIPWADCESDAERLDVHNGLLLSAPWYAAFDRALVTFDDQGRPDFSHLLSEQARGELRWCAPTTLTDEHRRRLARHSERVARPP